MILENIVGMEQERRKEFWESVVEFGCGFSCELINVLKQTVCL